MLVARCLLERVVGVIGVLGCIACSQSYSTPRQGASSEASGNATASTAAPLGSSPLFAVLTGGPWNDGPARHDSVQIMGLDGKVIATATFTPRDLPAVGAVPLLQDEARVLARLKEYGFQ